MSLFYRFLICWAFIFFGAGILNGCKTEEKKETTTTTIQESSTEFFFSWERNSEGGLIAKNWSKHLAISVEENLSTLSLAADVKNFCPKFDELNNDDRISFFGELFVAMAKYESNFNPSTLYRECNKSKCVYSSGCNYFKDYGYCMKGGHKLDGMVISRGLLQLSLESSLGYGCSFLSVPNDLHDPANNLRCGAKIMARQVLSKGVIAAQSNYWAVLKPSSSYNKLSEIKSRIKREFSYCF